MLFPWEWIKAMVSNINFCDDADILCLVKCDAFYLYMTTSHLNYE